MPANSAMMLFSLAKETGWPLEYLLWELPISILNQGFHYYLYSNGVKVRRPSFLSEYKNLEIAKLLGVDLT